MTTKQRKAKYPKVAEMKKKKRTKRDAVEMTQPALRARAEPEETGQSQDEKNQEEKQLEQEWRRSAVESHQCARDVAWWN